MSSIVMAACTTEKIYSLEHIDFYAAQTVAWAEEAGVSNVGVCYAPLKDLWYDLDKFDLPRKFALGLCDGPPRLYGTRMEFFTYIAPRCTVVVVDDMTQDHNYSKKVMEWASENNRDVTILGGMALITKRNQERIAA